MRIEQLNLSEWGDALPSTGFEVFHTQEALGVMADHASGELQLYGGFNGEEPVALLPVFVQERPFGRAIVSPPPAMGVPHLGPLLMPNSPKRRKHEQLNQEFTEGVLEELDADNSRTLFRMICSPDYHDPRPYRWGDFRVSSDFTYHLPIEGESLDSIQSSFSRSLRTEIRRIDDLDMTLSVEGIETAKQIYEDQVARYAEQGETFTLTWEYVRDLLLALGDRSRVYVARDGDGNYLNGIIALYSNDKVYYWLGGMRATYENVSVNTLLHWAIISDVASDPALASVTTYDMVGANTKRLCAYKSKFGAQLVPYYVVETNSPLMDVAKTAYNVVKR
ncbi:MULTISPECIES: GNAT family N-acetyltransferase [unclassified Haladaptatus]|uniref:GNAT family N-acetyltransferase n=1 Tax=unclassified Haladaptatus TaxID=2622732 RepID=UPI0023E75D65|nr:MULTISPECIES: GNAT family N-acetyltransferase [unclassified Haladaptatus]